MPESSTQNPSRYVGIVVRMPPEMRDALNAQAKALGMPTALVARQVLGAWLRKRRDEAGAPRAVAPSSGAFAFLRSLALGIKRLVVAAMAVPRSGVPGGARELPPGA